jgi:hypothetical protein
MLLLVIIERPIQDETPPVAGDISYRLVLERWAFGP